MSFNGILRPTKQVNYLNCNFIASFDVNASDLNNIIKIAEYFGSKMR